MSKKSKKTAGNFITARFEHEKIVVYEKGKTGKPDYGKGIKLIIDVPKIKKHGDKYKAFLCLNGPEFSFVEYEQLHGDQKKES